MVSLAEMRATVYNWRLCGRNGEKLYIATIVFDRGQNGDMRSNQMILSRNWWRGS